MTSLDTQVGKAIHSHMWDRHITQTAMAPRLGMTQSGLSKKLRGDRPWTLDELYRAADALGCPLDELLPRRDSNLEPSDYRTRLADVIQFRPRSPLSVNVRESGDYRTLFGACAGWGLAS
jgi:transcriptional regulator with XRE-family HTH domain